jgi:hypothetical protein
MLMMDENLAIGESMGVVRTTQQLLATPGCGSNPQSLCKGSLRYRSTSMSLTLATPRILSAMLSVNIQVRSKIHPLKKHPY